MSTWCFDDEIEAQEMLLELTCLVAFVFPFFGEAFVILVRSFRFFLLFSLWFFDVPQCLFQLCQSDVLMTRLKLMKWFWLWRGYALRFFLFRLSVVDFSMFLSVFFNIVNVINKWGWSSWNGFGSDLFGAFCLPFYSKKRSFSVCEVFGVLLFGRCFFDFPESHFCNDVNVMYSWRERSWWNYFGSDLFGVFCIPVFDESLTFPVSSCCFACCPVAFLFLSLGEAFVYLVRIVRYFAAQPLVFRCSSMSFSTLSNLYSDDEVEAHRVIWADFLWILNSQFLISFVNRDRNFRCFARQLLAFRCPSMSFQTMSTCCFDEEVEAQEMILALTFLVAFVFPFFGEAFVILVQSFRFFLLFSLWFFDVPQCLFQPCQIYI